MAYYYLHINGKLLAKAGSVVGNPREYFDSDFVVKWWSVSCKDDGVAMLKDIENNYMHLVLRERLDELVKKWNITSVDYFRHAVKKAAGEE